MAIKHCKEIDELFETILGLESLEDCYNYFEDLCTIKEISDMALRYQIAMLIKKGMGYKKISDILDVSMGTIVRVNKAVKYGAGGYQKVLEKVKE